MVIVASSLVGRAHSAAQDGKTFSLTVCSAAVMGVTRSVFVGRAPRLVEQGLFADEAQAMVNTWSRS